MKRLRRKGLFDYSWKSNPNAVYVGRPSRWGNPFKLTEYTLEDSLWKYWQWINEQLKKDPKFLDPLRGKDLVCWCPLDQPCHADVLIKYIEVQESLDKKCDCPNCQAEILVDEQNKVKGSFYTCANCFLTIYRK